MSKTREAVELVLSGKMNAYAAAEFVGIKSNSVYVALKRRRVMDAGLCPCCGHALPEKTKSVDKPY